MSEILASLIVQYRLTLPEAMEGFRLATLIRRKMPALITPLIGCALILFGWFWQENAVGRYYMALGALFLGFQIIMHWIVMPWLFRRQYKQYRYGELTQHIELYQNKARLKAGTQQKEFTYAQVQRFVVGQKSYLLELDDRSMLIVSKQAVLTTGQPALFEQAFQK